MWTLLKWNRRTAFSCFFIRMRLNSQRQIEIERSNSEHTHIFENTTKGKKKDWIRHSNFDSLFSMRSILFSSSLFSLCFFLQWVKYLDAFSCATSILAFILFHQHFWPTHRKILCVVRRFSFSSVYLSCRSLLKSIKQTNLDLWIIKNSLNANKTVLSWTTYFWYMNHSIYIEKEKRIIGWFFRSHAQFQLLVMVSHSVFFFSNFLLFSV